MTSVMTSLTALLGPCEGAGSTHNKAINTGHDS
jgi:hypothetical protein